MRWKSYRVSNQQSLPQGNMKTFEFGFAIKWSNIVPFSRASWSAPDQPFTSTSLVTRARPFDAVALARQLSPVAKASLGIGAVLGTAYAATTTYLASRISKPGNKAQEPSHG
ncbi:MAG TPA: hypothetical protein VGM34_00925 [Chlamydiales bacterium]